MSNTAEKLEKDIVAAPTEPEQTEIGATESRLLQAMAMGENLADEAVVPVDYVAYAGKDLEEGSAKAKMFDIVESIRTVSDPEIPINVYDMGLIYKIDQKDDGNIYIEMTLTAPTCPIAGVMPQQVADAVAATKGVGKVEVKLVWEPAWTPDKMTDEAKEMLELL